MSTSRQHITRFTASTVVQLAGARRMVVSTSTTAAAPPAAPVPRSSAHRLT